MRRSTLALVLAVAMVTAAASPSRSAVGTFSLAWGQTCPGIATSPNLSYACNGTASHSFVVVLRPSQAMSVRDILLEIDFAGYPWSSLPEYWKFGEGECRAGSLSSNFEFTGFPTTLCRTVWEPGAQVTSQWSDGGYLGRVLLTLTSGTGATPMSAFIRYYLVNLAIDDLHEAECWGCEFGATVCLTYARVTQQDGSVIQTQSSEALGYLDWQGGSTSTDSPRCGFGLPTRAASSTWGQIRTLYR